MDLHWIRAGEETVARAAGLFDYVSRPEWLSRPEWGFRDRGLGTALSAALADLARGRASYGTWALAEPDDAAALWTYQSAGATQHGRPAPLGRRYS